MSDIYTLVQIITFDVVFSGTKCCRLKVELLTDENLSPSRSSLEKSESP